MNWSLILLVLLLGFWLIVGAVLFTFWFYLADAARFLFFIVTFFEYGWLLIGLVLFLVLLVYGWKKYKPITLAVISVSYVAIGMFIWFNSNFFTFRVNFELHRPLYEKIVAKVYTAHELKANNMVYPAFFIKCTECLQSVESGITRRKALGYTACEPNGHNFMNYSGYYHTRVDVDAGPPIRIAILQPGGILDNWVGVVYDPADEIPIINGVKADFSNFGDPKFEKIKYLFGGDMYRCVKLRQHWYLCWFT